MGLKETFYPESRFGGFSDVDGTLAFYQRVNALLQPGFVVLDLGCGRGAYANDPLPLRRELRNLKGKVKKVIGLDVDPAAAVNPFIDEFQLLDGPRWPLEDRSLDLLLSDHVLEHLAEPEAFFSEACRLLRPAGYLCLRTTNAWSYVALASRLVPNRMHGQVLDKVKDGQNPADVFPTFYRCNSLPKIRNHLKKYGFDGVAYGFGPEPSYLSFSRLAYWLGIVYGRLAPRLFQPVIFVFARRTG
jgi:SAM-dependent methyltransferase